MIIYQLSNLNIYTGIFYEYQGTVAPQNTATIEPPEHQEGFARKFDAMLQEWGYVPLEELQPPPPPLDEAKAAKIPQIDAETSAAITAGFTYEVEGTVYHFSYDSFDQQNFADTAMVATLVLGGQSAPGMPQNVTWNAYTLPDKTLARLTFTPAAFLGLYTGGALAHKATQMELGGQRKAAVEAATSIEEVNAA